MATRIRTYTVDDLDGTEGPVNPHTFMAGGKAHQVDLNEANAANLYSVLDRRDEAIKLADEEYALRRAAIADQYDGELSGYVEAARVAAKESTPSEGKRPYVRKAAAKPVIRVTPQPAAITAVGARKLSAYGMLSHEEKERCREWSGATSPTIPSATVAAWRESLTKAPAKRGRKPKAIKGPTPPAALFPGPGDE